QLLRITPRQCVRLGRIMDPKDCTIEEHREGLADPPPLPSGLTSGIASQARALSALRWGDLSELETFTSRVQCPAELKLPGQEETFHFDLVWGRDRVGRIRLLDLDCS
ncbi:MAG: hypothetical protein ACOCVR_03085, partial [Myxococcota bacterium]